jgi:hypothetical protein
MYVPVRLQAFAIRAAEMVQGRSIPAARVPQPPADLQDLPVARRGGLSPDHPASPVGCQKLRDP